MKKYIIASLCLLISAGSFAQLKDFSYKFYGQIRTDFFYNSRANEETVDGLFYMYPKDKVLDPDGNDLNSTSNSSFYTLYTRLGVDVAGPKLGNAKTSAKVEIDFRGSGTSYSTVRIRHAYFNLDWGKSAVMVGQYWHPLFGDVSPQILNLSVQPCSADSLSLHRKELHADRSVRLAIAIHFGRDQRKEPGVHQEQLHTGDLRWSRL